MAEKSVHTCVSFLKYFVVILTDPVGDFIDKITFRPCEDGDDCDDLVSGYQCQCFPVYALEDEQPGN